MSALCIFGSFHFWNFLVYSTRRTRIFRHDETSLGQTNCTFWFFFWQWICVWISVWRLQVPIFELEKLKCHRNVHTFVSKWTAWDSKSNYYFERIASSRLLKIKISSLLLSMHIQNGFEMSSKMDLENWLTHYGEYPMMNSKDSNHISIQNYWHGCAPTICALKNEQRERRKSLSK